MKQQACRRRLVKTSPVYIFGLVHDARFVALDEVVSVSSRPGRLQNITFTRMKSHDLSKRRHGRCGMGFLFLFACDLGYRSFHVFTLEKKAIKYWRAV